MLRMGVQIITAELRRWLAAQVEAGLARDAVIDAMIESGWRRDVALGALDEAQRGPTVDATAQRDTAGPMPQLTLADGATTVAAGDREVRLIASMQYPRVVILGGLLSAEECDALVALARQRLERSETVTHDTGSGEVNAARTSDGMFFARGENALVARIEARVAALVNWPVEQGEGLQVLRYRSGDEYKPHYDYFDLAHPGTASVLRRGGQRVATLVMYLNTPLRGGATIFPDIALEVMPQRGNAVFFSYDRPHPDTRTLHGGAPVLDGEKWVATKWLHERRFK